MPRDSRVYLENILLIHAHSRVDLDIIWDVVANKLPEFEAGVRAFLEKSGG